MSDPTTFLEDQAIAAIKEALAQPEQEPVALVDIHAFYEKCANFYLLQKLPKGEHYLYTTPQQRTWVGLTDDEIEQGYETTGHYQKLRLQDKFAVYALAKAIEVKLKQKNGFAEEKKA